MGLMNYPLKTSLLFVKAMINVILFSVLLDSVLVQKQRSRMVLGGLRNSPKTRGRVVDKFSIALHSVDHSRLLFDLFFHN